MGRSSSKREEIYAFLKDYIASHGYPPTTREIMAGVGLRSTASVHYHLSELSRSGAIEMDGGKNRAISLGAEAAPQGVPLIGVVTAGQPILAVENIEGYVPWEAEAGCFALRVRGDSMIEAGIFDGDKVVVRPQQTAEIVVVDAAPPIRRQEVHLHPLQPVQGPQHGVVLAVSGQHMVTGGEQPVDGDVQGLGGVAGEHHPLRSGAAQQPGQLLTGAVDDP